MRNEAHGRASSAVRGRGLGHAAALAAGAVLAFVLAGAPRGVPGATAGPREGAQTIPRTQGRAARVEPFARGPRAVARMARVDNLPARVAAKLDQLGRGEQLAQLRPYFPATARGVQLAAYTALADDIPDATEAGVFARRELLPDLLAHGDEAAADLRAALLAMPRGDGDLYAAKELLINFISGHATLAPTTITSVLGDYLATEDPTSEAYSLAAHRLQVVRSAGLER